jgi:molybdopterin synthase catalytic subunit
VSASLPFGLLLTGGSSTRMGRDKAQIEVEGISLARRAATALVSATDLCVEVGPGHSGLPALSEEPAGEGPLVAIVAGWHELVKVAGDKRPAVVVACDLPELDPALVAWLARHPADASVVPVATGRPQPLCARWSVTDLERATAQVSAGERSLQRVFGPDALLVREEEWGAVAAPSSLRDVDTPEDLASAAIEPPPALDDWIGLSRRRLPTEAAAAWATLPRCGAVVTFAGTVRDHADERRGVEELTYEAYEEPALDRMAAVVAQARRRWPDLGRVGVLHRLGRVPLGEVAVTVVVSAAHRQEAFAAAAFVIDTVKDAVPIWKYERWDGGEGWGTGSRPVRPL